MIIGYTCETKAFYCWFPELVNDPISYSFNNHRRQIMIGFNSSIFYYWLYYLFKFKYILFVDPFWRGTTERKRILYCNDFRFQLLNFLFVISYISPKLWFFWQKLQNDLYCLLQIQFTRDTDTGSTVLGKCRFKFVKITITGGMDEPKRWQCYSNISQFSSQKPIARNLVWKHSQVV